MTQPIPKIAFVSPHCVLDYTNGAATATRDALRLLAEQGFDCQAFCGTRLDDAQEGLLQESLFRRGVRYEVRKVKIPRPPCPHPPAPLPPSTAVERRYSDARLLFTVDGNLPVTVFENASTRGGWLNVREAQAFLTGCDIFLRKNRPDVVWTYGGDPVSIAVQNLAKRLSIRVLFTLYNFSYFDRRPFEAVDCVAVPCEFSRRYYHEKLGLDCRVLPVIVNWKAAKVREEDRSKIENCKVQSANLESPLPPSPATMSTSGLPSPPAPLPEYRARGELDSPTQYVTFINPHVVKGVYIFARIARELARRRPDIPILVTQGRSRADALMSPELGLADHIAGQFPSESVGNGRIITVMPFMPDPRTFYPTVYSLTRLLIMPSLWNESFGLVAAEAMLNGIPVLASNRGALPDTIGDAGFLFDIPAKFTPETREVPSAEEVEPWVDTIIRLWDDAAEYKRRSQAARAHAQQWHPDRLAPIYHDFFSSLTNTTLLNL
jgi:glycosyltransferase involved in cell wall biosynthesis